MIQLEKIYNTRELAEAMNMKYDTFRKYRDMYERHLELFYEYKKSFQGMGINYFFTNQFADYIPYKEYRKMKKYKLIQSKIAEVLALDNRQTASNIARLIEHDDEVVTLNLQLSTLSIYVRNELQEMIDKGVYIKSDYQWCYLNEEKNVYILIPEEEVKKLKKLFPKIENIKEQENNKILKEIEKYYNIVDKKPILVPIIAENTN